MRKQIFIYPSAFHVIWESLQSPRWSGDWARAC